MGQLHSGTDDACRVAIHIGYPKTGTTTLQRHLFGRLGGYTPLIPGQPGTSPLYRELGENLRTAPAADFLEATTRAFLAEVAAGGRLLWSDEQLAGDICDVGQSPERVAERLHRLAPDARILVCVRHQGTLLGSLYSRYVKQGGYCGFADFVEGRAPGFPVDLDRLAYDGLVRRYQQLFGADHVVVVAYEQWRGDQPAFVRAIASFLDQPLPEDLELDSLPEMNRSLSIPSRWALRRANRLFRKSEYNARPQIVPLRRAAGLRQQLERIDKKLIPGVSRRLGREDLRMLTSLLPRFESSNEQLARATSLPLAELGYPLPRRP